MTKKNIEKIKTYLESKFSRCALALSKFDFNMGKSYFKYVVMPDFDKCKKCDDSELFKMYKTPKEIQHIIKTVIF